MSEILTTSVESSSRVSEASNPFESVRSTATSLLQRPEVATWEGPWYSRDPESERILGKRDVSETFIATRDRETNTSFMVHTSFVWGKSEGRNMIIRWADLPGQVGEFVKGGGYIRYTYDAKGNVVNTETGKWQGDSYNDEFWFSGEGSTSSLTDIDWEGTPFAGKNPLTNAEVADITARFQRSSTDIDSQFSKQAAHYAKINDQLSYASYAYTEAVRSGKNSVIIENFRQNHLEAVDAYYIATGRDPKIERAKWAAIQREKEEKRKREEEKEKTRIAAIQNELDHTV